MKLDSRELATVLAALRGLQQRFKPPYFCGDATDAAKQRYVKESFPEQFGEHDPLTLVEIDSLCEQLNCCPCANTPLKDRTEIDRLYIGAADDLLGQYFDSNNYSVHEDAEVSPVDDEEGGGAWVDCQVWVADDKDEEDE